MRTGYWVGLFLACILTVNAQSVPYSFNYQGVLRGGSGDLLGSVQKTVEFRLFDSATGGTPLWGRTYAVLLDTNGLFNVELSDAGAHLDSEPLVPTQKNLNLVIASGSTLYLGLTVNGAAEIAPRQQLLSVPFAMMAGNVSKASGNLTVSGSLTVLNGVEVTDPGTISGHGTMPLHGIIMWSGSQTDLPKGWALCNGEDGTPDLRNRFIVGAGDEYTIGDTGGVAQVTLTTAQIPNHTHQIHDGYYVERKNTKNDSSYDIFPEGGGQEDAGKSVTGSDGTDADNTQIYYRSQTTEISTEGGGAHENLPPYYALCFIIRIK